MLFLNQLPHFESARNLPHLTFAPERLETKLLRLKASADFVPALFDMVKLGK